MRIFLIYLLLLCLSVTACAETAQDLPGLWAVHGLSKKTTFTVYSGPGEDYFVAVEGRAKVSTNGQILCYGRVGDWLMIRYSITGGVRVGYINAADYPDVLSGHRELTFDGTRYRLEYKIPIKDDPERMDKSLGTVSGEVTLLAYETIAGQKDWVYVEGILDNRDGAKVRGFVPKTYFDKWAEAIIPPEASPTPEVSSPVAALGEIPELPQMQLATDLSPGFSLTIYTGPCGCMLYVCAGNRTAWASTNGEIYVFGETEGLHSGTKILIAYQTDSGNWRVGYTGFKELIGKSPALVFSNVPVTLPEPLIITDDPFTDGEPLGTISGEITILATLGDWYYVDGVLDGLDPVDRYASRMVRGFVRQSDLQRLFELP